MVNIKNPNDFEWEKFSNSNYSENLSSNKRILVFGDSIVAGQAVVRFETPYRDSVYARIAAQYLKAEGFKNLAMPGTGQFKGQVDLNKLIGWRYSFENVIEHFQMDIVNANIILIAYGNNDWKQPNATGELHSLDEVKDKLKQNIETIRSINSTVRIIGVLQTKAFRNGKDAALLEGPNGFTFQDTLNAYIEVYDNNNVEIFDIRQYGLGESIEEYVDDRDHFTLEVHQKIGRHLSEFINKE